MTECPEYRALHGGDYLDMLLAPERFGYPGSSEFERVTAERHKADDRRRKRRIAQRKRRAAAKARAAV